jgi:hypothetical protein
MTMTELKLPDAFSHPRKKKPVKKSPPHQPAMGGMGNVLDDWDPPKSKIANFWDTYHNLEVGPETPQIAKMKADIEAAANSKGLVVKGDLDRNVRAFLIIGKCPWVNSKCPCDRVTQEGFCKKGMLVESV